MTFYHRYENMRGGIGFETSYGVVSMKSIHIYILYHSIIGRGKCRNYQMIFNILLKLEWTIRVMLCRGVIMYFLVCFKHSYHVKNPRTGKKKKKLFSVSLVSVLRCQKPTSTWEQAKSNM